MTIESASPATQRMLDRIREELASFESYEKKDHAAFKSDSTGRVFAFLNPRKQHIRLFLLLERDEDPILRPGPSTGHYAKWASVYYIEQEGQLPKARELILRSYERDSVRGRGRRHR